MIRNQEVCLFTKDFVPYGVLAKEQQRLGRHEACVVELGVPQHPVVIEWTVNKGLYVGEDVQGDDPRWKVSRRVLDKNNPVAHLVLPDEAEVCDKEGHVVEKDTAWKNEMFLGKAIKGEAVSTFHPSTGKTVHASLERLA